VGHSLAKTLNAKSVSASQALLPLVSTISCQVAHELLDLG